MKYRIYEGDVLFKISDLSVNAAAGVSSDIKLQINISLVVLRVTNSYIVLYNNMAK